MDKARALSLFRVFFHRLSETERPHVRPDLFDVCQALFFSTGLPGVVPPERVLPVGRPDRILFFMVHDGFVA